MRIPHRAILDPDENAVFAVPAVALSLYVFAYSTIYGQVSILAFYACWFPLILLAPGLLVEGAGRVALLLLLPFVAALSTVWSDAPATTLRSAIQYGTTILCGLIAARSVSIPNLALGGLVGGLLILLYSFSAGGYSYDVVDGSYAFSGAFASKNQLGFYASLTILFGLAILFVFGAGPGWKTFAALVTALAAYALVLSDSATSILTVLAAIVAVFTARAILALPPRLRTAALLALVCLVLALAAVALQLGALDAIFAAFGKDATLTGRTYLWNQGILHGNENPLTGLGYNAFWVHGRPAAEELWREFYIDARTGFHFHNTLIEAYVGLGLVGVMLVGGLTLALVVLSMRVLMNRMNTGSAMLCAGLALLFVSRSAVEIDFFTPYTTGSFMVPYLLLRMGDMRATERGALRSEPIVRFARSAG